MKKICIMVTKYKSFKINYYFKYYVVNLSGKTAYSIGNNVDAIRLEIYTHGPVEAAFTVYEDFVTYKSG